MEVDLEKLRELCTNNKNLEVISKTIESLHDRQDYARYHFHEFKRLSNNKKSDIEALQLASSLDEEYIKYRIAMKSNIVACMQNMHIIHDLLGWLIFKVLDLNISNKVSLYIVKKHLKCLDENKYENLLKLLIHLVENEEFQYLCDLVNHSKHKYTIEPKFKTNFTGKIERVCYCDEFSQAGNSHEKKDIELFIIVEYAREAKLIIQIENELIKILEDYSS